jgi:prepilin-type N-terminal cleavage/methylation domain-containing protein
MNRNQTRGFTLVELVVAIVVISMAGTTLVGLLTYMSKRSAEEMTRSQSAALAQS